MRKLMSLALALVMSLALAAPAAATEVGTAGSGGSVPVTISADATAFSVTVPASIPVSIDAKADVTCPSNLSITNDSAGPVKVTGISVKDGTWTIASYNGGDRSALAAEKVNSNKLGIAFTPDGGTQTASSDGGTQNLSVDANEWVVSAGGSLGFDCDAIASAVSSAITTAVHAVDVVFTVGWSTGNAGGGSEIPSEPYLTFTSPSAFSMSAGSKSWNGTLEYSTDTTTWSTWNGSSVSASSDDGEYALYFRGIGNTVITGTTSHKWTITGTNVQCHGNIETLLDYATVEAGNHPSMGNYCYRSMFYGCTSLTTAPALPTTTLASNCYCEMFSGCTSLTTTPALPATTLAIDCYNSMFYGCTSLTAAPALPATTLANFCYYFMFKGCTSLTTAPTLPATTLEDYCYASMFSDCTSLTIAPALSATTLANHCYNSMFQGCTSLTTVPALPATTLASDCYYAMFRNCTSIKVSETQIGDYMQAYRIPQSGTGTSATSALTNMFNGTGGTFTDTPSINTTYYLHSSNSIVG